jgi:hypothetical protein
MMTRVMLLFCCALLACAGCGDGDGDSGDGDTGDSAMIDWDLSGSHTTDDVDWPRGDLSAVVLDPVESVSIRLPKGRRFEGDGEVVHDVSLERRGDSVQTVQVDSYPRASDEAYRLALSWADEWGLPTEPLASWREDASRVVQTSVTEEGRIGPDGPVPTVQIRPAEDGGRVSLQFYWPS